MNAYPFETVILTSRGRREIHAAALRRANPGVEIHVWEGPDTGVDAWRNCDRNIRQAWRELAGTIRTGHVLFLEWDVRCDVDLRTVFPDLPQGLMVAHLKSPVADRRAWLPFRELDRLPENIRHHAIGCVPSAVALMSRQCADMLASQALDYLFALDIISEIRMGSAVREAGFRVVSNPALRLVGTTPMLPPAAPCICHPVKQEVAR